MEMIDQTYHALKGWDRETFSTLTPKLKRYYDCEISRIGLSRVDRAIEIGFGSGQFLQYCRSVGIDIVGLEINRHQISLATEFGYKAMMADDLSLIEDESIDACFGFDVFEHISREELIELFSTLKSKLRSNGVILGRVPNGDGPFGLFNQNGDLSHVTSLGSQSIAQLASLCGLNVHFIGAEANPILCGDIRWTLLRLLLNPIRRCLDLVIRWTIFPRSACSFTAVNMTFILKK